MISRKHLRLAAALVERCEARTRAARREVRLRQADAVCLLQMARLGLMALGESTQPPENRGQSRVR